MTTKVEELRARSFSIDEVLQQSNDFTQRWLYLGTAERIVTEQEQRIGELEAKMAGLAGLRSALVLYRYQLEQAPVLGTGSNPRVLSTLNAVIAGLTDKINAIDDALEASKPASSKTETILAIIRALYPHYSAKDWDFGHTEICTLYRRIRDEETRQCQR